MSSVATSGGQFLFVLGVIAFTVIVGSLVSNIAIIGMVGALIPVVAPAAGINPAALLITAAIAANMDFALPVGTPPERHRLCQRLRPYRQHGQRRQHSRAREYSSDRHTGVLFRHLGT